MADGPVRVTRPLLAVLDALLEADGHELHGWAIMKRTGRSGPTIYKILERLTDAGWLVARWEQDGPEGKPRRRYYRLTGHGLARAKHLVAESQHLPRIRKLGLAMGGCT